MSEAAFAGSVARLWTFPVKSMKGERFTGTEVTRTGLAGDRGYAISDLATGKIVSAKSARLYPGMFGCKASFLGQPSPGKELPPVQITLPDGRSVTSDSPDVDAVLSEYLQRDVRLVQQAPDDFTIDMYHPDVAGADPAGYRDTVIEQKVGSAYWKDVGLPSPVPQGSFMDLFPVTILTTATLDHLNGLQPGSIFDERRFRVNFIVETIRSGFVENDWVGRTLMIGERLLLRVEAPDSRCVMTTLAQDDLPADTEVLRTLVKHNRIEVGGEGRFPCAGVYAVVEKPGRVRVGDQVRVV